MIRVFDSHCHLQDEAFAPDREDAYRRAVEAGVGMVIPGYSVESSVAAVDFAAAHDLAWAMVGVHPHDARAYSQVAEQHLTELTQRDRVVGIGEIGLDYHYNHSTPDQQREAFRRQLELSVRLNLPVSIHSREAEADTLAVLRSVRGCRGVLHCFTGSMEFARELWDMGFVTSFAGVITFKNAQALRDVVAAAPWDKILVETDAPYLTPDPWRGRRNEPLRVLRVAEMVAMVKNCSEEEVFSHTMANIDKTVFPPKGWDKL